MTPARWGRIKEIFGAARERPESQRAAFLDSAYNGDVSLRAEVAALLAEGDGDSLLSPAAGEPATRSMLAHRFAVEVELRGDSPTHSTPVVSYRVCS